MPELREDAAACLMDGVRDRLPGFHLLARPDAGCKGPTKPLPRHADALADNQPGCGALPIIIDHDGRRDMGTGGTGARKRRHQYAIAGTDGTQLDRFEEAGH